MGYYLSYKSKLRNHRNRNKQQGGGMVGVSRHFRTKYPKQRKEALKYKQRMLFG